MSGCRTKNTSDKEYGKLRMYVEASSTVLVGKKKKKSVYPWKVVVVNYEGHLNDKAIKEKLTEFNPVKVRSLWAPNDGFISQAIVEFTEDWSDLTDAMSLEIEFNSNQFWKKHYGVDNRGGLVKVGMCLWVAKEDDYNSECLMGQKLRRTSTLESIEDVEAKYERKNKQEVSQLKNEVLAFLGEAQFTVNQSSYSLRNLTAELEPKLKKNLDFRFRI
ncbi:factor of DNA methylation 4-like [Papaver somniferum]|uniref:factor of DNA methylation 4-like n=1 Tax=Papaver somniferum TaxID=3469 RepID=UPI000E70397B|nr:factor of DNA methylation 4-like [Papaver somniferum]